MSTVATNTYTSTHSTTFVSDRMRLLLKILVSQYGLNPEKLVDAWHDWVDRGVKTWLESGHLKSIVIEFYMPGSTNACARWDFPISYTSSGFEEMWDDRKFFEAHFAKAAKPPENCDYRIVLTRVPGYPPVAGISDTTFRSTSGLTLHEAGTVIATPHMTAGARYYRK